MKLLRNKKLKSIIKSGNDLHELVDKLLDEIDPNAFCDKYEQNGMSDVEAVEKLSNLIHMVCKQRVDWKSAIRNL